MIMAALMHEPKLLLVDEPIVGLDPTSADTATRLFKEYAERHGSVLISTHTLAVAENLCHRFLILYQGKILAQGTLEELRSKTNISGSLNDVYLEITKDK